MKLLTKTSIRILIVFLISIAAFVAGFYKIQDIIITHNFEDTIDRQIDYLGDRIEQNAQDVEALKETLEQEYVRAAKTVAFIIKQKPEIIESTSELENLRERLNVEEIHVIDDKGILRWGTREDFYGFDFKTSEQTKPFLSILENNNQALAQEPSKRGVDGRLFQYIGVAREDEVGIVQIGVLPERLSNKLEAIGIDKVAQNIRMDEGSFVVIVESETNRIVSSPNKENIGKTTEEIFKDILDKKEGSFWKKDDQENEYFCHYKNIGDYKIIGIIAKDRLSSSMDSIFVVFIGLTFLVFVACILLIRYILTKYVVIPLRRTLGMLEQVEKGNLSDRLESEQSKEFNEMSVGVNHMIEHLQSIMKDNAQRIYTLEQMGEQLGTVTTQTTESMEQIADKTQHLVERGDIQNRKAKEGERVIKSIKQKTDSIHERIKAGRNKTLYAEDITNQGMKSIQYQIEAMYHLIQEFKVLQNRVLYLSKIAVEIDKVLEVNQNITKQIELLAINASIEAARVGELGSGFNVVAGEIKRLAYYSKDQTNEVSKMIGAIKETVVEVRDSTDDSVVKIEEQGKTMEDSLIKFRDIVDVMKDTNGVMQTIWESSEMITDYTTTIELFIEEIGGNAKENSAIGEEISHAVQEQVAITQEIKAMAEELKEMVKEMNQFSKQFKM